MDSAAGTTRDPARPTVVRAGIWAWTIIGIVTVVTIAIGLLATVSEIVLPLLFAVMTGAVARPLARWLQGHGLRPATSAAATVLGLLLAFVGLVLVVVQTVVQETGRLAAEVDQAMDELAGSGHDVGLDPDTLSQARSAVESIAGVIGRGLLTAAIEGVNALVGFVGGTVLGLLIMYYLLKDGPEIRVRLVDQLPPAWRAEAHDFIGSALRSVRAYWAGRCVLSAAVTAVVVVVALLLGLPLIGTIAVVNFLGGFVPYIGAFIGGGLATLLALADGGVGEALVMLAVVLIGNLLLENLLEPRIMSGRLHIHPLAVLIATTVGGVVGGLVGLMLAVPTVAVGSDLVHRISVRAGMRAG